jgi:diaminopimelate epimerase
MIRFVKMQGAGNDYVYVDCFQQEVADPADLAVEISDRHFGVGGDGLVLIGPSDSADLRMRMFNADGTESEMCGNAIRCVAKYACDRHLADGDRLRVETMAGVKAIDVSRGQDGKVSSATVDMGEPILDPPAIPVNIPQPRVVDTPLRLPANAFAMTCVSMGNPHAVIFVNDLREITLGEVGPQIENHPLFPQRTNAHFVQVLGAGEVSILHWERGSGPTLACGTGASACCVAGVLTGRTQRAVTAHLPGGDLVLTWRESDNHVLMTGPAVEVFSGEYYGGNGTIT